MNSDITRHMSWEAGVDLVACTQPGLATPNVILHVAKRVNTPAGSTPAGMIFWQPDPAAAPVVVGFVAHDPKVGAYFGPAIFAGTPFEHAPVLTAGISITEDGPGVVSSHISVPGYIFDVTLRGLGATQVVRRAPGGATPFHQLALEAVPTEVELKVNGRKVDIIVPPVGISGGPAAVWSPSGIYAR